MEKNGLRLYGYWRSSAAYRVRIALNLKGLDYDNNPVHLVKDDGHQHRAEYGQINPQRLVPVLEHEGHYLRQSMAIMEYLDERWPELPALLPEDLIERQRVRALSQLIVSDIHPLNNLRIMRYFEDTWHVPRVEVEDWVRHWIEQGFNALENTLSELPASRFCVGETPTIADCCLIPQIYNARRFSCDMQNYPTLMRIQQACMALPAFEATKPENQPDATHI